MKPQFQLLVALALFLLAPTPVFANSSPIANAGPDLEMYEAEFKTFDGSASTDPNG